MWSKPQVRYNICDMNNIFSEFLDCEAEIVHWCMHDNVLEHIRNFGEIILIYESDSEECLRKCPVLTDIFHTEDDIIKAIEAMPSKAACGPNGWSANFFKAIKHPLAHFLVRIHNKSVNKGYFLLFLPLS